MKNLKLLSIILLSFILFFSNKAIAAEEKPIIKNVNIEAIKVEEGTKLTTTIIAESPTPIRYIFRSFEGPINNIYGGGIGVNFEKIGENLWEYSWSDIVAKEAPSGIYKYEGISIENQSFLTSEVWPDALIVDIQNDPVTEEKPVIRDAQIKVTKVEEGTKLTTSIIAESKTPIRYIYRDFDGPTKNIYGGGIGVNFEKIGENLWEYSWSDTVSKYSPSGTYKYKRISVENQSFLKSDEWDKELSVEIENNLFVDEKPIVKEVNLTTFLGNDGLNLKIKIIAQSPTPIRFINRSFEGPVKNIYGGGIGVNFEKIGENLWEYSWIDKISRYSPSGTYKYERISVENQSFLKSDDWNKEVSYYFDSSIFDNYVKVEGINIQNKRVELYIGENMPLEYSIEPKNATNKDVIIENSNEDIISLNDNIVTALKEGYVTINIKTIDGNFYDYIYFVIKKRPEPKPINPGFDDSGNINPPKEFDNYYVDYGLYDISSKSNSVGFNNVNSDNSDEFNKYLDVKGHWAESVIRYVIDKGYFIGTSKTTFSPNEPITQGQLVTVLGRKLKVIETDSSKNDHVYYESYMKWAKEFDILEGINDTNPDRNLTREEMAIILNNFIKFSKINFKIGNNVDFKDKNEFSINAISAINNLVSNGYLKGMPDGTFSPKSNFTRAQLAQVLYNFDNLN